MKDAKGWLGLSAFLLLAGISIILDLGEETDLKMYLTGPGSVLLGLAIGIKGMAALYRAPESSGLAKLLEGASTPMITVGFLLLVFDVVGAAIRGKDIGVIIERWERLTIALGLFIGGLLLERIGKWLAARRS